MKKIFPHIALSVLLVGCSSSVPSLRLETRVDPKEIESVPSSDEHALVGPPEIIEPEHEPEEGVKLRVVHKPGSIVEREISGDGKVSVSPSTDKGGEPATVKTTISIKFSTEVLSVTNGRAQIKVKVQPVEVKTSEGGGSSTQAEEYEVTVDDRGRVLTNVAGLVRSSAALAFVPFPQKRVKPGTTWKVKATLDTPPVGLAEITQSYTYRGLVKREGRNLWQVDTKGGAEGKVTIDGSYYFSPNDGTLVSGKWNLMGVLEVPGADGTTQKVLTSLNASVNIVADGKR